MPAKSSIDGVVAVAAAAAVSLGPVPHAVPAGGAPGAGAAPPHVLPAGSVPEGLAAAAEAVNLCFQGNFPQHAWRTRFQAFCLSSRIAHATRREHIHALAAKEGVDPARAWTQFFEAFPHATRYHKECGDTRQSWISYLEACCRQSRHPRDDYLFVWSAKSILFYCSHIGPSLCLPFANLRWLHHGRSGKQ